MKRRKYLLGVGVIGGVSTGVITTGTEMMPSNNPTADDETLMLDVPDVGKSDEGSIRLEAKSATRLRFSEILDTKKHIVKLNEVDFSPLPKVTWTVNPSTWEWPSEKDIVGEFPVRVPESVPSGSYTYGVTLAHGSSAEDLTKEFTLTIEE
jgi:hypothetical protein